jgi:hypothetical protein
MTIKPLLNSNTAADIPDLVRGSTHYTVLLFCFLKHSAIIPMGPAKSSIIPVDAQALAIMTSQHKPMRVSLASQEARPTHRDE